MQLARTIRFDESDGLFDNLHLDEIVETVRVGPLPRAVEALATGCTQRMQLPRAGMPSKPDDLTLVLFRMLNTCQ